MEKKIATCPFCSHRQTIVAPTLGSYRCQGCRNDVPQEKYQLEDPPPPKPDDTEKRIRSLETAVDTLEDLVTDLQRQLGVLLEQIS